EGMFRFPFPVSRFTSSAMASDPVPTGTEISRPPVGSFKEIVSAGFVTTLLFAAFLVFPIVGALALPFLAVPAVRLAHGTVGGAAVHKRRNGSRVGCETQGDAGGLAGFRLAVLDRTRGRHLDPRVRDRLLYGGEARSPGAVRRGGPVRGPGDASGCRRAL